MSKSLKPHLGPIQLCLETELSFLELHHRTLMIIIAHVLEHLHLPIIWTTEDYFVVTNHGGTFHNVSYINIQTS